LRSEEVLPKADITKEFIELRKQAVQDKFDDSQDEAVRYDLALGIADYENMLLQL